VPIDASVSAVSAAMSIQRNKTLKIAAGIAFSFAGLAAAIIFLTARETISIDLAKLMLAGLVGLYVGFGVLIAVYRLIGKLD
jgi:hypothetical protein